MPTPLDARWFVIDRAVMAYKGTETEWRCGLTPLLTRGFTFRSAWMTESQNRYWTRSVTQTIFRPKFYECWRENTPSYDAILECTRTFFIGKHRYKVPCVLQDGVIARKKNSDVFLQPKHIGVSLLVWYLFCDWMLSFQVNRLSSLGNALNGNASQTRTG
jgi:hypothetical protein